MKAKIKTFNKEYAKPMIKVGGRPVLETIILNCSQQGLKKFYISLNYKGESIEKYFGDGMKWGVSINYLKEKKKLGTAGIIKELKDVKEDILVINGDILTTTDFNKIINFHKAKKSFATMITKKYETVIPYGVVEVKQDIILNIKEKPLLKYNINAGIYIINPTAFKNLNTNEFLDMTELFNLLISNKKKTCIYEIDDYWLDIGRLEDLQKQNMNIIYFLILNYECREKRILVDMSATILHHGHIRLLKKASKLGVVVVALTRDKDIKYSKGYVHELNYNQRKEILCSIRYVDEVIPSPWFN